MIETIQRIYREADFDFRRHANPSDELRYLWDDWIEYYRLKYAICRCLQPRTILEIGVRYGYSAAAFLAAAPDARYVGIDNDSPTWGGAPGAISWARQILSPYDAEVYRLDTQQLDSLPGDHYDLIHVDGQQDGEGTFHDLGLAFAKGGHVMLEI